MRPRHKTSLLAVFAFLGVLLASESVGAQGDEAGPVIEWSVGDGVGGVDLPLVVTGQTTGPHGLKRLDVSVGLGLQTRKFTATGGRFAIVVFGEPTGSRGRFILGVEITDFQDNVAVRTAEIAGRRPSISLDPLEPVELEYPIQLGGTANSGFRAAELKVEASVGGRSIPARVQFGGAEYGGVQQFNYWFDPRLLKNWVWAPGDTLDVTFSMVDLAKRRVERVLQVPLPRVDLYCGGYGVTTNLADRDWPTNGADVILGTPGPDLIYGLEGPDVICGLGGDDVIVAGGGNDVVNAGPGNDLVFGEAGNDVIEGRLGDDRLFGGDGNDRLIGNSGEDTLRGEDGADTANGGINRDTCEAETQVSCEGLAA